LKQARGKTDKTDENWALINVDCLLGQDQARRDIYKYTTGELSRGEKREGENECEL